MCPIGDYKQNVYQAPHAHWEPEPELPPKPAPHGSSMFGVEFLPFSDKDQTKIMNYILRQVRKGFTTLGARRPKGYKMNLSLDLDEILAEIADPSRQEDLKVDDSKVK